MNTGNLKVLVTGANGFVGKALCTELLAKNYKVRGAVRDAKNMSALSDVEIIQVGHIDAHTDWKTALKGIDVVVHLAGTVCSPDITDPNIYNEVIAQGTINLAQQATELGIKRIVFMSTSFVYGIESADEPILEAAAKSPQTHYGKAKLEAERQLIDMADAGNFELTIIRPPLVYGKGVKGGLSDLVRLIKRFWFLPLGCATKERSFVAMDNLISFTLLCMTHEKAKNQVFNVSDNHDLSVRALCKLLAKAMGRNVFMLPIPRVIMRFLLTVVGRVHMYGKLYESVLLDVTSAQKDLGWQPVVTPVNAIQKMFISEVAKY